MGVQLLRRFAATILCVMGIALPIPVTATFDGPMKFLVFWPCAGNGSFCAPRILAEGKIEIDSAVKFLKFLRNKSSHEFTLTGRVTVAFDSPGGNLAGGLQLGRLIRKLKMDTELAPSYAHVIPSRIWEEEIFRANPICTSACSFAFLGGINRSVSDGAKFGVHQFSGMRQSIGDSETQVTVVMLGAYLAELGISRTFLDVASLVPASSIYWLSQSQLQSLRIDNTAISVTEWRLEAMQDGSVFSTITQIKPGNQIELTLILGKTAGKPVLVARYKLSKDADLKSVLEALNEDFSPISLRIDGKDVAIYKAPKWEPARNGGLHVVLNLSPSAIQRMKFGSSMEFRVDLPNSSRHIDPSMEFPLAGLSKYLPAVMR